MARASAPVAAADQRDDLVEQRRVQPLGHVGGQAAAVEGAQIQAHAQAQHLHLALASAPGDDLLEVVVEVVGVVGQVSGAVRRAAVGTMLGS